MDSLALTKRLYRCEIFTEAFRIEGKLEPMGEIITALGDNRRICMTVYEATITPISAQHRLGSMAAPELVINKKNVVFVALLDKTDYEGIRLAPNIQILTAYTQSYAIQGEFHLGGEMRVRDFIDTLTLDFAPVTNVKFFTLAPPKVNLTATCPFIILNKNFIAMYHGENTGG